MDMFEDCTCGSHTFDNLGPIDVYWCRSLWCSMDPDTQAIPAVSWNIILPSTVIFLSLSCLLFILCDWWDSFLQFTAFTIWLKIWYLAIDLYSVKSSSVELFLHSFWVEYSLLLFSHSVEFWDMYGCEGVEKLFTLSIHLCE